MKTKKWLLNSAYFDTSLLTITTTTFDLWADIIVKNIGIERQPYLVKEALGCICANLYINLQVDKGTAISLHANDWTKKNQPEIKWSSYNTVSKLIKELYRLKYIDRIKGFYGKNKKYCGKYWLIPDTELIKELDRCSVRKQLHIHNIIRLRDCDGNPVKYSEVGRVIKPMKRDLRMINKQLTQTYLTYSINIQDLYDVKPKKFIGKCKIIATLLNTGQITLTINNIGIRKISFEKNKICFSPSINLYHNSILQDTEDSNILYIDTDILTDNISLYSPNTERLVTLPNISNDIRYIHLIPKDTLLSGEILNKSLFRVFNRGDKSFKLGGRFYNSSFQQFAKVVRNSFKIDNEDTVSLDYSGMHIRMLYHLTGQEFNDECYVYPKGVNEDKRNQIKYAALIIINAKNRGKGLYAIRDELKAQGIPLPYDEVVKLSDEFEEYHSPLEKYFYNDMGIILQNYDSTIMNDILSILYDKDIIALPIHDEIICQRRHEEFVLEVMKEKYKDLLGYDPVIPV